MKSKILNCIFLIAIFVISFSIRIYKTGDYPPLLWDEAALGYNALSILETGKDEYGIKFPLIFKSFGDYKPGIFVYLIIPFIKILGLNEFSTRLPSILCGSLLPILLYFLVKVFDHKANRLGIIIAIISAFNPYNIHFSKGAWETNVLTFQLVLASFLFFKFIKSQKIYFILFSALTFGISLYTYQAAKMISLFIILILIILNFSFFKKNFYSKFLPFFVIPLLVFSLAIISGLLFNQNANRLKVVSLFSYPRSQEETNLIISESSKLDYQIFYNRLFFFSRNFLSRYFNNFSPKFLLFEGDWQNARHSAPYIGVILYPSIIFLLIGLFTPKKEENIQKLSLFFLLWFLIAPIPAALTRDSVQSVRSMSFSIPLVYFISLGIYLFLQKFKHPIVYIALILVYSLSFIYYSDLYYNHMVKKSPNDFLYGYKQVMQYVVKNKSKYDQIYITDFYGQPYIFYLFYSQYPAKNYQKQAVLAENEVGDTGKVNQIDNIHFESVSFQGLKNNKNKVLGIMSYDEVLRQGLDRSPDFKLLKPLSPINNHSTFYAYEN